MPALPVKKRFFEEFSIISIAFRNSGFKSIFTSAIADILTRPEIAGCRRLCQTGYNRVGLDLWVYLDRAKRDWGVSLEDLQISEEAIRFLIKAIINEELPTFNDPWRVLGSGLSEEVLLRSAWSGSAWIRMFLTNTVITLADIGLTQEGWKKIRSDLHQKLRDAGIDPTSA